MGALINLMTTIFLMAFTYLIGSLIIEKRHYASILTREKAFLSLPVVTSKEITEDQTIEQSWLVKGNVVVSLDYFKRFLAGLRNIFGGRVKSYETLIDRARREAILRMKQEARNADMIINMRFETSTIGQSANKKQSLGSIEVLAYGTALKFKA